MRGCEGVIHFAAESHVDRSIYEPTPVIETNVTGTFILLQVARRIEVKRFVHISTDEVYGDLPPGTFADEKSPLKPSRSEEHTSELQSPYDLVCRLLLEKKNICTE